MIKPEVDRLFHFLESAYEYDDRHVFPTEIWETLLLDPKVKKSLEQSSLNQLVMESFMNVKGMEPFSETMESTFVSLCNNAAHMCGKGVDSALSVVTAGLAYYGFMEGLLETPISHISCNSDEACVACLLCGEPIKDNPLSSGDATIDVLNILKQDLMTDSQFERFVGTETQSVSKGLQNLTKLLPWSPMENPTRSYPIMIPEEFGISVEPLVSITRSISIGRLTPVSTIAILDWIRPDRDKVFQSFGSGNWEACSVIGTYLTFVYHILKKITLCDVTAMELTPMFKYLIDTLMEIMPDRLDNRYVQLSIMAINAMIASIEGDYFHKYSDTCIEIAKQTIQHYDVSDVITFAKKGICAHGVPDDMYEWMSTCLKSNVLPEKVRQALRNASLYPMIGPVRLLFEHGYFGGAVTESTNRFVDNDAVCESMVRSLFDAVDPVYVESLRVDTATGESGASGQSVVKSLCDPTVLEAVLSQLHDDARQAANQKSLKDIAGVMMTQRTVLKVLGDNSYPGYAKLNAVIEATRKDVVVGRQLIQPYKNVSSFRTILESSGDAMSRLYDIIQGIS